MRIFYEQTYTARKREDGQWEPNVSCSGVGISILHSDEDVAQQLEFRPMRERMAREYLEDPTALYFDATGRHVGATIKPGEPLFHLYGEFTLDLPA